MLFCVSILVPHGPSYDSKLRYAMDDTSVLKAATVRTFMMDGSTCPARGIDQTVSLLCTSFDRGT
jgi:hypothetical protein